MQVQRIYGAMPVSAMAMQTKQQSQASQEKFKNVTNPFENNSSSKASQIARNYFLGGQNLNISFTGFPCSTGNFRVKELEDMPCTCCGRPMMTNRQIDEFTELAGNASGENLNQILDEHMDYFRAEEKAVVHYIQKQLKDMPDASLTTAISRKGADAAQILEDEQIDVIRRTSAKSVEILGEDNAVQGACDRALKLSFGITDNRAKNKKGVSAFSRQGFLDNLVELEQKKGIAHSAMHKILDVAVQLPESQKTIQKMITKYGYGSDDTAFARRLIQKAVVTAEHIHPKSKGGPNATDNYMGECQECNGSRGNMDYDVWMRKYPNMPDNIQVNADAVTEEIIKGKIGGNYDDYPVDLQAAVKKETGGKVVITVKNPEEIDKAREERGLAQPIADANERANAAGAYQGSYHGPNSGNKTQKTSSSQNAEKTEKTEQAQQTSKPKKSGKKKKGKKHVVRFPEAAQTETAKKAEKAEDKKVA